MKIKKLANFAFRATTKSFALINGVDSKILGTMALVTGSEILDGVSVICYENSKMWNKVKTLEDIDVVSEHIFGYEHKERVDAVFNKMEEKMHRLGALLTKLS